MKRHLLLIFGLAGIINFSHAQNQPIGEWEEMFSYTSAQDVLNTDKRIFCSSYNGFFSIGKSDKQIRTYSKSDGLAGVGISCMAYDQGSNAILIAYRSGNLDLLQLDASSEIVEVVNLPVLNGAANLPATVQLNRIIFHEGLAYVGSNFGIIVIDTRIGEVHETYRYIGQQASEVNIKDLTIAADSLFAITSEGILGTSMKSSVNRQYFANWRSIPAPGQANSIVVSNGALYGGFSEKGILKRKDTKWTTIYASVSPTSELSLLNGKITAVLKNEIIILDQSDTPVVYKDPLFTNLNAGTLTTENILWLADRSKGLIANADNTFRTYNPPQTDTTITTRTDSSVIDQNGLTWTRLPDYLGGGIVIKDVKSNKQRFLSMSTGNGGLPSSKINSLAVDTDGYVWFASDKGVGYFLTDEALTVSRLDAILPIFGQRRLLSTEQCTSLAIEPGNRKWVGTNKGLYMFTADGSELLLYFSAENSPLPSNQIKSLKLDPQTGLLFVDTADGVSAYRTGASSPAEDFSTVTIFPNPVHPGYSGNLGIKGLKNNSTVKITTLSGRLVYEARSQGGTVSWNLSDYTGRRATGGIYIVMTVSEDKSAKFAGKFAIIE